ncbi:MAG: Mor transcription activator family protein [Geobacteraceae bacterium]|nr:Mor transcription activator family protein [Geobacteraceae bacterium]
MKYLEYLKIEELPEQYQDIIRVIGLDATLKLAQAFPGVPLYFKQVSRLLLPAKKAFIRANFDGGNHRRLALDTELPLATVYEILTEAREAAKQCNLFDQT